MGKEKIEEKDVRLLRYAVEQAFDGAMRDGALSLLNRLVDGRCRTFSCQCVFRFAEDCGRWY